MLKNKKVRALQWTLIGVFCGFLGVAQASISLSATRVIFNNGARDSSIVVRNVSDANSLIQSWVESNEPNDEGDIPFAVTPPLARLDAKGQQFTRVIYSGGDSGLPKDRESIFWLNVQEIPQAASEDENNIQVAVRQRIKVFYRPKGLPGTAAGAAKALTWRVVGEKGAEVLEVENPTAYHVSTGKIYLKSAGDSDFFAKGKMVPPYGKLEIPFAQQSQKAVIRFSAINDYGAADYYEFETNGNLPVSAAQVDE